MANRINEDIKANKLPAKNELKEGEHFYFNEQGYMVFTEAYHKLRGYCCGNGCKHCPYNHKNVQF
ncbi:MAG: DUF5522 domain-containing protein [Bacteroidota bacterium]